MRPMLRCTFATAVAFALSTATFAQTPTAPVDAPKPPPKAAAPDKPKKPATKAGDAKKADAKKATPKKKPEAKKADAQPKPEPKVYTTGPKELRDKDGNVIPTSPDAYNVDSAMPPKPRK